MVYKITEKRNRVFIEAIILTAILLLIGFVLGYMVESYRTNKVITEYRENEISALDLKLQNYYYQIMDQQACDAAIKQNFIFADKIYNEGLAIEKFEEANQLTENIISEKRRYSLLKTELWLNSILLKEKCDQPFDTLVYLYSHDPSDNALQAQQQIISNVLRDVKAEKGDTVILLPIAGDMDLGIVDLQMRIHKVTSLPSIIINEEVVLEGYHSSEEILSYFESK